MQCLPEMYLSEREYVEAAYGRYVLSTQPDRKAILTLLDGS